MTLIEVNKQNPIQPKRRRSSVELQDTDENPKPKKRSSSSRLRAEMRMLERIPQIATYRRDRKGRRGGLNVGKPTDSTMLSALIGNLDDTTFDSSASTTISNPPSSPSSPSSITTIALSKPPSSPSSITTIALSKPPTS